MERALSFTPALPFAGWTRRPTLAGAVGLLLLAILLRSSLFGDPFAGYDEQFYLLTGDRLLHGGLPYVDIWDRKPPGLFLIYAGIRLLGGDGIVQYQLVATLFVAATGFVIALHARRRVPDTAAFACGALYVLWTGAMGGEAGQSPLFYNLPVALAALLVIEAVPEIATRRGFLRACAAMAVCGLALTIKTTVIFEAAFFGLALVIAMWRSAGVARTAAAALLWMALGAAPFLSALAFYAAIGHLDAFWFANATSAALRHDGFSLHSLWFLLLTLAPLGPLALLAFAGQRHAGEPPATPAWERRFLIGWTFAATIGFAAIGYFYHHYALPLLVPLAIAAARFLAFSRYRKLALVLFAFYPATQQIVLNRLLVRDDRADAAAIATAIPARAQTQCMLVFSGPPILYRLANACLVSKFAFPDHLHMIGEAPAIGVPQAQAVAEALARHPAVIAIDLDLEPARLSPAPAALVRQALAGGYRLRATLPFRYFEDGKHRLQIWERQ
jgi:4-amino-4-deoxy-L-arabinose transferase-like glycosyltransferase